MEAGHRVTNVRTIRRNKPIIIRGKQVKKALPLHSFVVSSLEREPYTKLARAQSVRGPRMTSLSDSCCGGRPGR